MLVSILTDSAYYILQVAYIQQRQTNLDGKMYIIMTIHLLLPPSKVSFLNLNLFRLLGVLFFTRPWTWALFLPTYSSFSKNFTESVEGKSLTIGLNILANSQKNLIRSVFQRIDISLTLQAFPFHTLTINPHSFFFL
jgi:hypothetical protein